MKRSGWLLCLAACHSGDTAPAPAPTDSEETTKILVSVPSTTSPVQDCRIRIGGDAFAAARSDLSARAVAAVHVDGDYTHVLAKVVVEPAGDDAGPSVGNWSGSFNGPRDAFVDLLKRHVCTATAPVHVLLPRGAKDPSKGEVVLDVFATPPDEHHDVDSFCHAYERAPKPASADKDERDRLAMQWVEDVLTTQKWDDWRRAFARERGDLFARKGDAGSLFRARGTELGAAAKSQKLGCPTASEWTKR